jgi:hypothetical protein
MSHLSCKNILQGLEKSKLLLLVVIGLSGACYEVDMTIAVNDKNPPTFELSGSGNLNQFLVMEVPSWNQTQTIQRRSDVNTVLWKIRPSREDKIWYLPPITYGQDSIKSFLRMELRPRRWLKVKSMKLVEVLIMQMVALSGLLFEMLRL